MDWIKDRRVSQVLDALASHASHVSPGSIEEIGATSWVLPLGDRDAGLVYAELDGDWLRLGTPGIGHDAGIEALERNARLGGLTKLALDCGGTPPILHTRAELPVEEGDAFSRVLAPTLAGLAGGGGPASDAGSAELEAGEEDARSLPELCAAAGWPAGSSSGVGSEEQVSVDLGVANVGLRAIVERSAESGAMHASAMFDRLSSPSDVCRDAVARFLLRAASVVRMARPVASVEEAGVVVGFEVHLVGSPEPHLLRHAFAALHVAVRRTAREVAVLGTDEDLARAYLRFSGVARADDAARPQDVPTAEASTLAHHA